VERFNGTPTQIIGADAPGHIHVDSVSGELSDTAREVGRCSTKARPVRKHVPQYLTNTNDSWTGHHGEISSFRVMAQEKH
jgi:hypothetical protein